MPTCVHILPSPFTFEFAKKKLCPENSTHIMVTPDKATFKCLIDEKDICVSTAQELFALPFEWSVIIDLCDEGMWSADYCALEEIMKAKLARSREAVLYTNFVQFFNVWARLLSCKGKRRLPKTQGTPYDCAVGKIYKIPLTSSVAPKRNPNPTNMPRVL